MIRMAFDDSVTIPANAIIEASTSQRKIRTGFSGLRTRRGEKVGDAMVNIASPRLHIVLAPGFAGFDALGQLEYYAGLTPHFRL